MNWQVSEIQQLVKAIMTLETQDETKRFLRDLLTEGEIVEFAKRLQTAELLERKVSYAVIEQTTGFSSTTVARVSKWLNNGTGGYKAVLAKLHHHAHAHARSESS